MNKNRGDNALTRPPLEIIKCTEGGKSFMKERRARRPFGHTVLVCEYPFSPDELEEPDGIAITWRLAKRAARDYLRVSRVHSAIVTTAAKHDNDYDLVIRVLGKYD